MCTCVYLPPSSKSPRRPRGVCPLNGLSAHVREYGCPREALSIPKVCRKWCLVEERVACVEHLRGSEAFKSSRDLSWSWHSTEGWVGHCNCFVWLDSISILALEFNQIHFSFCDKLFAPEKEPLNIFSFDARKERLVLVEFLKPPVDSSGGTALSEGWENDSWTWGHRRCPSAKKILTEL